MYKVEILTDSIESNIIDLLHTKDTKVEKVKDSYIMKSFVYQDEFKKMYKKLFNKKTNSPTDRNMQTFNNGIFFEFNIEMNQKGCSIFGEFRFPKLIKLIFLICHLFFLFIFYEFAPSIGLFIIIVMMPMILADVSMPNKIKTYRECVLCKIEENLKNQNVNIRDVKRYNFFNKYK